MLVQTLGESLLVPGSRLTGELARGHKFGSAAANPPGESAFTALGFWHGDHASASAALSLVKTLMGSPHVGTATVGLTLILLLDCEMNLGMALGRLRDKGGVCSWMKELAGLVGQDMRALLASLPVRIRERYRVRAPDSENAEEELSDEEGDGHHLNAALALDDYSSDEQLKLESASDENDDETSSAPSDVKKATHTRFISSGSDSDEAEPPYQQDIHITRKKSAKQMAAKKWVAARHKTSKKAPPPKALGQMKGKPYAYSLGSLPSKVTNQLRLLSSNISKKQAKGAEGKGKHQKLGPRRRVTHRKATWGWLAAAGVRAGVSLKAVYGRRKRQTM